MSKQDAEGDYKIVNRDEALGILEHIKASGSSARVGISFIKKGDGCLRHAGIQFNVTSHLAGGQKAFVDRDKGLLTAYEIEAEGYRSFSIKNLLEIRFEGALYKIPMEGAPERSK